jgi:ribosomal protein L11 methylase PrmA
MSRLNGLQDLVKVLFHKNVLAPIQDTPGMNIIDLGTGSGHPPA